MFIPLRTNRIPKRRPRVTEALIITNMIVYLVGLAAEFGGLFDRELLIHIGSLQRGHVRPWQLVTYQFLHDPRGIWHLAFNMLFLWVFGGAVEDRLSRAGFLAFYLLGGAVAGVAHMLVSPYPVIGASGSIAAVTGGFLALFPRSRILVLVFFFGVFSIPALWLIAFYFGLDLLRQFGALLGRGGDVAYMAHLAGYVYGFALAIALLAVGIIKREEFDVFFLFKQWRRRAAFSAANRKRLGPWDSASADVGRRLAHQHGHQHGHNPQLTDEERALSAARSEIAGLVDEHDLPGAADRYRAVLERAPDTVLSEGRQLDVANQLHAEDDYDTAARAYELLLRHFPACPDAPEVRLILGLLYVRRLGRPQLARDLLEKARARLTNVDQRRLAEQLLEEIKP